MTKLDIAEEEWRELERDKRFHGILNPTFLD